MKLPIRLLLTVNMDVSIMNFKVLNGKSVLSSILQTKSLSISAETYIPSYFPFYHVFQETQITGKYISLYD